MPLDLYRRLGEPGLVGDGLEGYGCPPMSDIAAGLVHMELHRGDGSVGTFLGVRAGPGNRWGRNEPDGEPVTGRTAIAESFAAFTRPGPPG